MPGRTLAQLASDYWDTFLAANPVQGIALADHRKRGKGFPKAGDSTRPPGMTHSCSVGDVSRPG